MARYLVRDEGAAAGALLALVRLARRSNEDFAMGPLATAEIVQEGLWVTGAEALVSNTLGRIEGVAEEHTIAP